MGSIEGILEVTFCAKRISKHKYFEYIILYYLELTTMRHKAGKNVEEYSSREETILHELCNISTSKRSPSNTIK